MLLKEFLELGKTCKVCGDTDSKGISVRTIWGDEVQNVENRNGLLTFKFMGAGEGPLGEKCYEIFKFKLDEHTASREIHNPSSISMMYHNNFIFKIACQKCNSYSFESSLMTYHPMGSLTSDIHIYSEEVALHDDDGKYKIKNLVHSDKIELTYRDAANREGKLEFPFMKLHDFPIKNKTKMLKKIRTLMLLSG